MDVQSAQHTDLLSEEVMQVLRQTDELCTQLHQGSDSEESLGGRWHASWSAELLACLLRVLQRYRNEYRVTESIETCKNNLLKSQIILDLAEELSSVADASRRETTRAS